MNSIEKLKELFMQLPGIGPRQAGRFVHFLLMRGGAWRSNFVELVQGLDSSVAQCDVCMRFFEKIEARPLSYKQCSICTNVQRDESKLLLVVSDVDIKNMEKSGAYDGKYFVLGSLLNLRSSKTSYIRLNELKKLVAKLHSTAVLSEIIFALPTTPDGEHTSDVLQKELKEICVDNDKNIIKITMLGRGMSTGSEVEYADPETLTNALKNRA